MDIPDGTSLIGCDSHDNKITVSNEYELALALHQNQRYTIYLGPNSYDMELAGKYLDQIKNDWPLVRNQLYLAIKEL